MGTVVFINHVIKFDNISYILNIVIRQSFTDRMRIFHNTEVQAKQIVFGML